MNEPLTDWTPTPELPSETGEYWVTCGGRVYRLAFVDGAFCDTQFHLGVIKWPIEEIEAWQRVVRPKPFTREER